MNSGCKLIATVHGNSIDDIQSKPVLGELISKKIFERYILLNNRYKVGDIEGIYNVEAVKIL